MKYAIVLLVGIAIGSHFGKIEVPKFWEREHLSSLADEVPGRRMETLHFPTGEYHIEEMEYFNASGMWWYERSECPRCAEPFGHIAVGTSVRCPCCELLVYRTSENRIRLFNDRVWGGERWEQCP